ncbi:hypothetical protein CORC01_10587 [Colletotrichum orchidophilum]|uniref:ORP1 like protein n=1 Tax=Colletotrichum orchidophilum TaxID=1209926 RepID=A0A1G4AY88_9PEZI|nr:uncharacterized protein CORC01_10587 [Colletotrichum orchidophilum]OHE94130.1 hypothetical protein CORC01_10587 [Colletotrichum orchidophilum]
MDVTSLLNVAAGKKPIIRDNSLETISVPIFQRQNTSSSPEKIASSRRTSDPRAPRNRTPWDAGGYSLPLALDTKFPATHTKPTYYSESDVDQSASASSYDVPSSSCHSRASSLSSLAHEMAHSANITPMTSTHPGRYASQNHNFTLRLAKGQPAEGVVYNAIMSRHIINRIRTWLTFPRPSIPGDSDAQLTARPNLSRDDDGHHATGGFPKSPKHKFSDSHSSLSSYTSSNQSGGHSRISSLSTVSGIQPFTSLLNDVPAFDRKLDHQQAMGGPGMIDIQPPSPRTMGQHDPVVMDPAMKGTGRPGSPSDAILITRGMGGSNRSSPTDGLSWTLLITSNNSPHSKQQQDNLNYLSLPQDQSSRTHKRAVSAPDFAAISAPTFQPFPSVSETAPFPPQQQQTYGMSPPDSPPAVSGNDEIKCMYIENCDTGSQPRKAISHIFGRNKLCTRMIPAHVWVHFCRKHYQRSRYRNAHEYSKLQVDLVQKQIARVQQWSDENERAGKAGVVNSWSLAIRKREQKRLEDKKESKKRAYQDESEDEQLDGAMLNGTAVPEWLLSKCGAGYTTVAIQEIVAQLKTEIDGGSLSQIPDIEILPTISSDGPDEKPKTYLKRKTSGGAAHKRSQSMGVALRPEALPMARRVSQPNAYWGHESKYSSSFKDWHHNTDISLAGFYEDRNAIPGMPRVPSGMRRMNIPHRPAFGNIRENHPEEDYYRQPQMGSGPFIFGAGGPQGGPLPAPTPQRRGSKSMASHLETSTPMPAYPDPRRAYHQRSQSEIGGGFHQGQNPTYRPNSSSGFGPYGYAPNPVDQQQQQQQQQQPDQYDGTYPRPHDNPFAQAAQPNYYEDPQRQYAYGGSPFQPNPASRLGPVGANRHTRHQSTPNAPRAMHRAPSAHGFAVAPNQQGYDRTPEHSRHSSYATPPMQPMQTMQPMNDGTRH